MKISIFAFVLLLSASGMESMGSSSSSCTQDCNLVNTLAGAPEFSALVALVRAAGLEGVLAGQGPFTVFAPCNSVFDNVYALTLIGLAMDLKALKTLLLRHVVPGKSIMAMDIPDGETILDTASPGESLTVMKRMGKVMIMTSAGSACVVSTDLKATNGVVHHINALI